MNENTSRSKELLNKVYDHLDGIDISKLSLREISDFLEVVQKGRFLETTGQMPGWMSSAWGGCSSSYSGNGGKDSSPADGDGKAN